MRNKPDIDYPAFLYSSRTLLFSLGVNAYLLSVAANALKLNGTVNESVKRVVRTLANVVSGVNMSSALSYENISRRNKLSVRALNAKSFGLGIAAVLGRTHSLFMSEILQTNFNHFIFLPT